MEKSKEERMKEIMKMNKKQIATMLDHAMQENKNWDVEYNHLEAEYEKLLAWKNELKERIQTSIL